MGSPRSYHCRHAPWHAFVEIFEVAWSDGPNDLLCDFDDARYGRYSFRSLEVVREESGSLDSSCDCRLAFTFELRFGSYEIEVIIALF